MCQLIYIPNMEDFTLELNRCRRETDIETLEMAEMNVYSTIKLVVFWAWAGEVIGLVYIEIKAKEWETDVCI